MKDFRSNKSTAAHTLGCLFKIDSLNGFSGRIAYVVANQPLQPLPYSGYTVYVIVI